MKLGVNHLRIVWCVGAAVALSGCLLGMARGDYWTGATSGQTHGECGYFEFELMIEDGRVSGSATSEHKFGTVLWSAQGMVNPDGAVVLETAAHDPRVDRQSVRWAGTLNVFVMELVETGGCSPARAAKLVRR
jgi:hypothetical protein